ncbi:MAG: hypothetical protein RIR00_15 [Pseudomonadota bacterium]|jgi:chromate transporter
MPNSPASPAPQAPGFAEASRFWLKLGCISFGGPAGQIALMHRELVEQRRWLSERRFLHALNYCMLLPGPEAQQLATYLGWLLHRTAGGLVAGILFVLPSLMLLIGLSWAYLAFAGTPLLAGVFYGIKPAVTALVLQAAWRIGQRTLRNRYLQALALAAFLALFALNLPFPLVIAAAALAGYFGGRRAPQAFAPGGHGHTAAPGYGPALHDDDTPPPAHARFRPGRLLRILGVGLLAGGLPALALGLYFGGSHDYSQMARFFTQAALLTFGGAYAVLPYVFQGAVEQHAWLSAGQMIDGLALGESTPGPLIMIVAFVGYLGGQGKALLGPDALFAAGALGALVATWFTFLPSFLFIFAGAPLIESSQRQLKFTAPLTGITAAVVGVILNLALFFAGQVLWPQGYAAGPDLGAAGLAALSLLALLRFRVGVLPLLSVAAVAGLLLRGAVV